MILISFGDLLYYIGVCASYSLTRTHLLSLTCLLLSNTLPHQMPLTGCMSALVAWRSPSASRGQLGECAYVTGLPIYFFQSLRFCTAVASPFLFWARHLQGSTTHGTDHYAYVVVLGNLNSRHLSEGSAMTLPRGSSQPHDVCYILSVI